MRNLNRAGPRARADEFLDSALFGQRDLRSSDHNPRIGTQTVLDRVELHRLEPVSLAHLHAPGQPEQGLGVGKHRGLQRQVPSFSQAGTLPLS